MQRDQISIVPIMALSRKTSTEPAFLSAHHVEAAHRIRLLFERSHLRSHVTMNYGPRVGSSSSRSSAEDIPQMAADARSRLSALLDQLPAECRSIVIDVCCFEKGLQDVERDRSWPRRSAKLVLRIGLDRIAELHGLSDKASGLERSRSRTWRSEGARPVEFG